MPSTHFTYGGSTAKRWTQCPGSVNLVAAQPPQESSAAAEEGTKAHDLLEKVLLLGIDPSELCEDKEMIDGVRMAEKEILGIPDVLRKWIEHTFELSPECGGTPDYACLTKGGTLHVVDFKYGRQDVEVRENYQLLFYASLLLEGNSFDTVVLTIVQPRTTGVSSWTATREYLEDFVRIRDEAIEASKQPDAALSPGDWCRWCPARGVCPRLHEEAFAVASEDFSDISSSDQYDRLLELLAITPAIKAMLDAIPEQILTAMQSGQEFPGWKAVQTYGHRRWAEMGEKELFRALRRAGINKPDATELRLKTAPTLAKEFPGADLEGLIVKPKRGMKVVPESARGEAVVFSSPAEDFAD